MFKSLLTTLFITIAFTNVLIAQSFTESSVTLGVNHFHIDSNLMGGGAVFFDYNNDGWQDIYITGGDERDQLFENDQTGNFVEVGIAKGLGFTANYKTNGVIAGDINGDGFTDLFVTTSKDYHNILIQNLGATIFTDISAPAGITDTTWSMTASFGDFNRDGLLDIHCGNYAKYLTPPFYTTIYGGYENNLYLNNGNQTFTDVSIPYNTINTGSALATAFTDFDNDSDMDFIIGNDFGIQYGGNALYQNNYPSADFTNISVTSGINEEISAMGIAIGDFDEDLDLDYYITNMMENVHHVNNFDNTFTEDAFNAGIETNNVVSWGTFYFDYDNDTYLDLFIASGGIMAGAFPEPNVLYQNQQNGTFLDVSISEGIEDTLRSRGAIYGDIDNDGDLDILVVNTEPNILTGQNVSLYKNNTDGANNWVKFKLIGNSNNKNGYGSHVRLVSNGRSWIREIDGGSSYLSHSSSIAHFGLGSYTNIDSVIVTWTNGLTQVLIGPEINQIHEVVESTFGIDENDLDQIKIYPNPTNGLIQLILPQDFTEKHMTITTVDGQLVTRLLVNEGMNLIDLSHLANGVYYMSIIGEDWNSMTKVIMNRK